MNELRKAFGARVIAHLRRTLPTRDEAEEEFKYLIRLLE